MTDRDIEKQLLAQGIAPDIAQNTARCILLYKNFLQELNTMRVRGWTVSFEFRESDATMQLSRWLVYEGDKHRGTVMLDDRQTEIENAKNAN